MSYKNFSLQKVKSDFGLTLTEGVQFIPETKTVTPSQMLTEYLEESYLLGVSGSEKARSEHLITPVLLEELAPTGRQTNKEVVYLLTGWGLEDAYVVLAIK